MIDIRCDSVGAERIEVNTITYLEDGALTVICEAINATIEGGPIPKGVRQVPITRAEIMEGEVDYSPYQFLLLNHPRGEPSR